NAGDPRQRLQLLEVLGAAVFVVGKGPGDAVAGHLASPPPGRGEVRAPTGPGISSPAHVARKARESGTDTRLSQCPACFFPLPAGRLVALQLRAVHPSSV